MPEQTSQNAESSFDSAAEFQKLSEISHSKVDDPDEAQVMAEAGLPDRARVEEWAGNEQRRGRPDWRLEGGKEKVANEEAHSSEFLAQIQHRLEKVYKEKPEQVPKDADEQPLSERDALELAQSLEYQTRKLGEAYAELEELGNTLFNADRILSVLDMVGSPMNRGEKGYHHYDREFPDDATVGELKADMLDFVRQRITQTAIKEITKQRDMGFPRRGERVVKINEATVQQMLKIANGEV